jgi:hypothetical protein
MEWLYSLCVSCHGAIHQAAKSMTLRRATALIVGEEQVAPRRRHSNKKNPVKVTCLPNHEVADQKKKVTLTDQNDALHSRFAANRRNREKFKQERLDRETWIRH